MAQVIPLAATPNQTLKCVLGGQYCTTRLMTTPVGILIDVLVNDSPVVQGVLCLDQNRLIRYPYLGFVGDLVFVDTQGSQDPEYSGLGSRYQLLYLSPGDYDAGI